VLTIEGSKTEKAERDFLYRGISTRGFKRQFSLADYVQVKGAGFDNGLLKIELVWEIPDAMKPRRIAINGTAPKCAEAGIESGLSQIVGAARRVARLPFLVNEKDENMRPTTANDNVFDFNALLHPGTVFEHPRDTIAT
jgi:hypothetical protein